MLRGLLEKLKSRRDRRKALEAQVKELKAEEEAISDELLLAMSSIGVTSAAFPGLGKLHVRTKSHFEIEDYELVLRAMLAEMVAAGREGRPWSDAQLFQKRLNESVIRGRMETLYTDADREAYLTALGVREVSRPEVVLTKN